MQNQRLLGLFFLAIICFPGVPAANILLFPFGHCFNSHLISFERLADILLENGHRVSMIINSRYGTYQPFKRQVQNDTLGTRRNNLNLIIFEAPNDFKPICEYDTIDFMLYTPINYRFSSFIQTSSRYCENILKNTHIMNILKTSNFDLFIPEAIDPCSRILADFIDIKFIPLMTTGLGHLGDINPRPPSYVPAAIAPFTPHMNFVQRLGNFIMKMMYQAIPVIMGFDRAFEELKTKYQLNTSLSLANTMDRASLKLVNSDFAIDFPTPIEPDTIMVGGFAVRPPKPLDADFETFMQQSGQDGVIIFTFGTLVKQFDGKWGRIFSDTFARLPQRILWRAIGMENNSVSDIKLSPNVRALPWLPQRDLIVHPKTRLLITHCGLNSAMEAAMFGVPVVAIPLSGDHFHQASKLTDHAGMGVTLDIHTLTSDILYTAITQVLNDSTYYQNAQHVAQRMRDQPMSKATKINYWVSYILRHSTSHLKSMAHKLSWFQYFSLDVILVLVVTSSTLLALLLFIIYKFLAKVLQYIRLPDKLKSA